ELVRSQAGRVPRPGVDPASAVACSFRPGQARSGESVWKAGGVITTARHRVKNFQGKSLKSAGLRVVQSSSFALPTGSSMRSRMPRSPRAEREADSARVRIAGSTGGRIYAGHGNFSSRRTIIDPHQGNLF